IPICMLVIGIRYRNQYYCSIELQNNLIKSLRKKIIVNDKIKLKRARYKSVVSTSKTSCIIVPKAKAAFASCVIE
ncbi:unnamed protein product, partial [Rotaria sordida]